MLRLWLLRLDGRLIWISRVWTVVFATAHLYPTEAGLFRSGYYLWKLPLSLSPTKVPTWKPACLGLSVSQHLQLSAASGKVRVGLGLRWGRAQNTSKSGCPPSEVTSHAIASFGDGQIGLLLLPTSRPLPCQPFHLGVSS